RIQHHARLEQRDRFPALITQGAEAEEEARHPECRGQGAGVGDARIDAGAAPRGGCLCVRVLLRISVGLRRRLRRRLRPATGRALRTGGRALSVPLLWIGHLRLPFIGAVRGPVGHHGPECVTAPLWVCAPLPCPRSVRRRDRPGGSVLRLGAAARRRSRGVLVVAGPRRGLVVRGVVVVFGLAGRAAVVVIAGLGVRVDTVAYSALIVLGIGSVVAVFGVHVCVFRE